MLGIGLAIPPPASTQEVSRTAESKWGSVTAVNTHRSSVNVIHGHANSAAYFLVRKNSEQFDIKYNRLQLNLE